MSVVPYQDGPVLRWIGVMFDLLGDHLAQSRVLGEPFSCYTSDGMPSDLDGSWPILEFGLGDGDDIGSLSQTDSMLECQFPFVVVLDPDLAV